MLEKFMPDRDLLLFSDGSPFEDERGSSTSTKSEATGRRAPLLREGRVKADSVGSWAWVGNEGLLSADDGGVR
jgi:hypothetical protein